MKVLRLRHLATLLALAAVVSVFAPVASAAPPSGSSALTVPISGSNATNSFTGQFTLTGVRLVNGALVAVGTLNGTVTTLATGATTTVTNAAVAIPVAAVSATCQILHLELGPL